MADSYELRADQLERAFLQMGLAVHRESSRVSRSEYVEVESPEYTTTDGERGEKLKFRVSDHELPRSYQQPDFDVIADGKEHGGVAWNKSGTWYEAVEWAGGRFEIEPKGNAKMLLAKAASQREQTRQAVLQQEAAWKESAEALRHEREAWLGTLPAGTTVRASKRIRLVAEQGGAIISNGPGAAGWMGMSNTAIASGMSKPMPLADVLAYLRIAPTPSSRELGSQAPKQSGMQERPAVRAGESGSLEEPAQLSGGAGSDVNATSIGADAQVQTVRGMSPSVKSLSVSLRRALLRMTRASQIPGMIGEPVPDPIAQDLLGSAPQLDVVVARLHAQGIKALRPIGGGVGSVALDAGDGRVVRLGLGALSQVPPELPEVIQPLASGTAGCVRFEVMPHADTRGMTVAHVFDVAVNLAQRGFAFWDAGVDNIGRLEDGRVVVIDPDAFKPRTSQHDNNIVLQLAQAEAKRLFSHDIRKQNTFVHELGKRLGMERAAVSLVINPKPTASRTIIDMVR